MNFANEASKLLTNKYFLYFIVFISATNVLGYIVTNKTNAVIFFALVAFLMTSFSKNMAVVLLVAVFSTNLLMANKSMREGLENANLTEEQQANADAKKAEVESSLTDEQKANAEAKKAKAKINSLDTDKLNSVDPQLGNGLHELQNSPNTEAAKENINQRRENRATNAANVSANTETEAFSKNKKAGFHNAKKGSSFKDAAPVNGNSRIDYATTLESAYTNLDTILGSDGINSLTKDTQKLMSQQQKLFDTVQGMLPAINQAREMMSTIDMSQLSGLANMADSLTKGK